LLSALEFTAMLMFVQIFLDFFLNFRAVFCHITSFAPIRVDDCALSFS
jgi:hypothetical protein